LSMDHAVCMSPLSQSSSLGCTNKEGEGFC
jgi:hypothetical protein